MEMERSYGSKEVLEKKIIRYNDFMTQEGKRQTIGHMLVWDMKYQYGAWYLLQVVKVGKKN